ncbi:MAG: glutamine--tRNA ligase, partial [Elusimicrobia bacterium]|nr:glutamine--tRNA ligase [Elusimicrobiota bacterium]
RRRGYTPASVRRFCDLIGVAKANSLVDITLLENCLREELNKTAQRVMGVLKPLKVVIDNYPDKTEEELDAVNNPEDASQGTRKVPFSKVLFIEEDDFRENPPKKFYRLSPGKEVRLRYAYFITCTHVTKDPATGNVIELHCTYDPATKGGNAPDGRKVKSTIHWVSAQHAIKAKARLYDHLFFKPNPEETEPDKDYRSNLNPESLNVINSCFLEPSVRSAQPGDRFQFERLGYFCVDSDSTRHSLVFNRTVSLRDTWAKISKKQNK